MAIFIRGHDSTLLIKNRAVPPITKVILDTWPKAPYVGHFKTNIAPRSACPVRQQIYKYLHPPWRPITTIYAFFGHYH